MPGSPYDLPPLTLLRAFEAAARRGAFNEAAAELNVTPGAISHNVKALERHLGVQLFRRGHRQVDLTAEGRSLLDAVERGLANMDATCRRLRRAQMRTSVDIAMTTAFSHLWFTPRLVDFWKDHARVHVNQQVSDQTLRRPLTADLAIEYSNTRPGDARVLRLFSGDVVPVCAPALVASGQPETLEELAELPLVQLDADNPDWTPFDQWFVEMGHGEAPTPSRRVNAHSIAIQLAEQGGGLALGWRVLIEDRIATGRLVALDRFATPARGAFYVVAGQTRLGPAGEACFGWFEQQVK